jgi:acetyl esterase/lipase
MRGITRQRCDIRMHRGRSADICCAEQITEAAALLYIHGGGWARGSKEQFHPHLEYFSNRGFFCASLEYRLAPEVNVYEQIADILYGYDLCRSYMQDRNIHFSKIIMIGSSAGAHLASLVSLTKPDFFNPGLRLENPWCRPDGCISITGPAQLTPWPGMNDHIRECIQTATGDPCIGDSKILRALSPITYADERAAPHMFILAEHEPFFPHEQVYSMHEKLKQSDVYTELELFAGAEHGFLYNVESPVQKKALYSMIRFIKRIIELP